MDKEQLISALQTAAINENIDDLESLAVVAIEQYPEDAFGYYFLGEANMLKLSYDNAKLCFVKAIELDDTNVDYKLRLATLKEEKGEYEDASIIYNMILDEDENNVHALIGQGRYALKYEEDEEEAIELLSKAVSIEPQNAILYFLRGQAYLDVEQAEDALADANAGLAITQHEAGYLIKINALSELEQYGEMSESYEALIDAAPDNPFHRLNYATHLVSEGDYAAAEKQLAILVNKEVESGDFTPSIHELYGVVLSELGKHDAAIATFDRLVEHEDSDWSMYAKRANAKLSKGDTDGALADLKIARKTVSEASKMTLYELEAKVQIKAGNLKEAGKLYTQMAKDESYRQEGFYGLGVVYHKMGKKDKALKAMQEANKKYYPPALEYMEQHLADVLSAGKDKLIDAYREEFEKNQASSTLQGLFGKVWRYSAKLNKMDGLPDDIAKVLQAKVADTTMILTAKGLVLVNPIDKKAQGAVYKIAKEQGNKVQIEVQPLDGSQTYRAELSSTGSALSFMLDKGNNAIHLAAQKAESEKSLLKKYFDKNAIEFLGEDAADILAILN